MHCVRFYLFIFFLFYFPPHYPLCVLYVIWITFSKLMIDWLIDWLIDWWKKDNVLKPHIAYRSCCNSLQKLLHSAQPQPQPQQQNDKDKPVPAPVSNEADNELVDDVVQVPQLSVLAELDDAGEGLLDDASSDKTEELWSRRFVLVERWQQLISLNVSTCCWFLRGLFFRLRLVTLCSVLPRSAYYCSEPPEVVVVPFSSSAKHSARSFRLSYGSLRMSPQTY